MRGVKDTVVMEKIGGVRIFDLGRKNLVEIERRNDKGGKVLKLPWPRPFR